MATGYPRVLDAMEGEFRKERNEKYEVFQILSLKQRNGESLQQFHSVLSGLAARFSFETLESRILRDVFIVNMTNYAKTYVSIAGGSGGTSTPTAGVLQIKTEPVSVIRGGYPNNRGRGRGYTQGRGQFRGGGNGNDRKCFNCDKPAPLGST